MHQLKTILQALVCALAMIVGGTGAALAGGAAAETGAATGQPGSGAILNACDDGDK